MARRNLIRALLAGILLLGFAAVTSGCNTIEGFGQDLSQGARKTKEVLF